MKWKLAAVLLLFSSLSGAETLNLEQYLAKVKQKHRQFIAIAQDLESASYLSELAYQDLAPTLTLKGSYLDDKKPMSYGLTILEHNQTTEYTLGVAKKFSTGTFLSVTAMTNESQLELAAAPEKKVGTAGLSIAVSQSLWKDGFGSNTRMKFEQARINQRAATESLNVQVQGLLVQAENVFWDYLYQDQELKSKQANLDRAKKIEQWVRNRVSNGIDDRSDLLNAQGLVAARDLELITAADDLLSARKQIINVLELEDGDSFPELQGQLERIRQPSDFIQGVAGRIVKLDTYLSVLDARNKKLSAEQAVDGQKPDLILEGRYGTNAIEDSMGSATSKISNNDIPTTLVSLKLIWMLDGSVKNAVTSAAKATSMSSELKMQRSLLESESSWSEYQRKHREFGKKIEQAAVLSKIQTEKAAQERDKLSKGRSVTSKVITAEQDAADAELRLSKLKAEMRKFEAQAKMYVRLPNQELL